MHYSIGWQQIVVLDNILRAVQRVAGFAFDDPRIWTSFTTLLIDARNGALWSARDADKDRSEDKAKKPLYCHKYNSVHGCTVANSGEIADVDYVWDGVRFGFRTFDTGMEDPCPQLAFETDNFGLTGPGGVALKVAFEQDIALGRYLPADRNQARRVNGQGPIVKDASKGTFRIITDCSKPEGLAPNARCVDAAVAYEGHDILRHAIVEAGRGCLISVRDISAAYRHVHIHPDEYPYYFVFHPSFGYYVDTRLSFGIRKACFIFSAIGRVIR
ncbi:hypothetical protein HDU93_005679, partial [Gonapodya sp. JEL0774]